MGEFVVRFLPFIAIVVFWVFIVLRMRRIRSGQGPTDANLQALQERVRVLEEAHERTENSIAELTEAQRFTADLLLERPDKREPPPEQLRR